MAKRKANHLPFFILAAVIVGCLNPCPRDGVIIRAPFGQAGVILNRLFPCLQSMAIVISQAGKEFVAHFILQRCLQQGFSHLGRFVPPRSNVRPQFDRRLGRQFLGQTGHGLNPVSQFLVASIFLHPFPEEIPIGHEARIFQGHVPDEVSVLIENGIRLGGSQKPVHGSVRVATSCGRLANQPTRCLLCLAGLLHPIPVQIKCQRIVGIKWVEAVASNDRVQIPLDCRVIQLGLGSPSRIQPGRLVLHRIKPTSLKRKHRRPFALFIPSVCVRLIADKQRHLRVRERLFSREVIHRFRIGRRPFRCMCNFKIFPEVIVSRLQSNQPGVMGQRRFIQFLSPVCGSKNPVKANLFFLAEAYT